MISKGGYLGVECVRALRRPTNRNNRYIALFAKNPVRCKYWIYFERGSGFGASLFVDLLTYLFTYLFTCLLTHLFMSVYLLTSSRTHVLTHPLTHPPTYL